MPQPRAGTVVAEEAPEPHAPEQAPPPPPPVPALSEQEEAAFEGAQELDPDVAKAIQMGAAITGGDPAAPRRMREAKAERPSMDPNLAHAELSLMLSAEPPPIERDTFKIKRLTTHYRELGRLPTPQEAKGIEGEEGYREADDPDDLQFHFSVTLRGLSDAEFEQLGERALREPTKDEEKLGQFAKVRDPQRMNLLMVAQAMENPNLRAGELLSAYGRPEEIVRRWFAPGEIMQLASWVNDLSGWGNAAVERARKS